MTVKSTLISLCFWAFANITEAKSDFPYPLSEAHAQLKEDDGVTFDPLGVAAILYNPRADKSAARLFAQYDQGLFTWPHMTMIGGTLPPMQMLVENLTATLSWINPAIKLCAKDTTMLPIRSDISGNVFRQLPFNLSNVWLSDVLSFRAKRDERTFGNDFAIVWVDSVHQSRKDKENNVRERIGNMGWRFTKWTLDLMCLLNGAFLVAALVCGILVADIWAFTLFLLYTCHWLTSVLMSFFQMVEIPDMKPLLKNDRKVRYAVYEREEGGTVIFKGPQIVLEEWARSTWEYNRTFTKHCLHWLWIITGSASGIASVACMVNMYGYMQLAFLGVLVYSSLAEIGATRIARILQTEAHGVMFRDEVLGNDSRTRAIIRGTLGVISECRLRDLDWVNMGLLPPMAVFREMQNLLKKLVEMQDAGGITSESTSYHHPDEPAKQACDEFVNKIRLEDPERLELAVRIRHEVYETLYGKKPTPTQALKSNESGPLPELSSAEILD